MEKFENNGVKSALVFNSKIRPRRFKILLNGHLDVVPGKEEKYKPRIIKNKLYGIGSMDMKAGASCLITAFSKVADKVKYPLGLQLVTDEEIGGFCGTKFQIKNGVNSDFIIVGESTNLNIVNEAKGFLSLKITSRGKTSHGAYLWRGENAIWKMSEFLDLLKTKYPLPESETWADTLNLSKIETTNNSFNKVPDDCTVWIEIRHSANTSDDSIIRGIKKLMPNNFHLRIERKGPVIFTEENNQYIKKLKAAAQKIANRNIGICGAHGTSDARHFSQINSPAIEFGPTGGNIGTDKEWIDISSLEIYCKILIDFLLNV